MTEESIIPQLVQLLLHPSPSVHNHALRAVRNVAAFASRGAIHKIECIIRAGALPSIQSLLTNYHQKSVKKEVRLLIIDIAHRGRFVQPIIEAGLIRALVNLLQFSDLRIKDKAVKAIRVVCEMCTYDQVRSLANDITEPLLELLGLHDPDIVAECLNVLFLYLYTPGYMTRDGKTVEVLKLNDEFAHFDQLISGFIERAKGAAQLIILLAHKNDFIHEMAGKILTRLGYTIRNDPDDELLDPSISFGHLEVPPQGFRFD